MRNCLAINIESTSTTVCLREAAADARVFIDDGIQTLIPKAVGDDESWGTKALRCGTGVRHALGVPGFDGWNDDCRDLFLGALYRQVCRFLGKTEPSRDQGFETILCASGLNSDELRIAAERSGFQVDRTIEPVDALARLFLATQFVGESSATWTVVLSSDASTTVRSYVVERRRGSNRILQSSKPKTITSLSESRWRSRIIEDALNRIPSERTPRSYASAHQEIWSIAARMHAAQGHDAVSWQGSLTAAFFSPYAITVNDCMAWPELQGLHEIDLAVEMSLKDIDSKEPDILIGGGIGFRWPFIQKALCRYGHFLTYTNPELGIALGATQDNQPTEERSMTTFQAPPFAPAPLPADLTTATVPDVEVATPPWQRGLQALQDEDATE